MAHPRVADWQIGLAIILVAALVFLGLVWIGVIPADVVFPVAKADGREMPVRAGPESRVEDEIPASPYFQFDLYRTVEAQRARLLHKGCKEVKVFHRDELEEKGLVRIWTVCLKW